MSWLKIDDNAPTHKKILRVSPAARWLWICGLAYCQRHRTDGLIPAEALATFGLTERGKPMNTAALGDSLIRAGLWHADADGYRVHDFLDWNESAADREEKTSDKTERQRKWRHGKRRDVDASTHQSVDASPRDAVDAAPTPTPTPTPRETRASVGEAPKTVTRRGYADPHGMRPDPNAVAMVVWGPVESPNHFSLPSGWFDKVRGLHGLSYDDADAFAKWLGPIVTRDGGVRDGGKFLAYLDAKLADWLTGRDEERLVAAQKQAARDFIAEQAQHAAASAPAEEAAAILRQCRLAPKVARV